MFNIPNSYKVDIDISLKDFIPKTMKPNDKKKVKDSIKSVKLVYQINGEEIPSVINDDYRCQVIQFYDIQLNSIKDARHIANIYQSLIKSLCVLRLYDMQNEVYSLAIKRLSQIDANEIVIVDSVTTDKYMTKLPDTNKNRYLKYMDYTSVKNKSNKVNLYSEWFYKTYMIVNEKVYSYVDVILEGNHWYDGERMISIYNLYSELVEKKAKISNEVANSERVKLNKEIKQIIEKLDNEKY